MYTLGMQMEHAQRLREIHYRHGKARALARRLGDDKAKYAAWLHAEHGASFGDIAAALSLSRSAAQKLVEKGNLL